MGSREERMQGIVKSGRVNMVPYLHSHLLGEDIPELPGQRDNENPE